MKFTKDQLLIVAAFFAIYVIWGSTYLWNKVAVAELPPFYLASIRFSVAGALILAISKVLGLSLAITKNQFKNASIAGILFLTIGNGCLVWALKYVESGFAALIISSQPLMILLMLYFIKGKKIQPTSIIGVILGIAGIYLLVSNNMAFEMENTIYGVILIFIALTAWSYGSIFVGSADLPKHFFVSTGYQMFIAGILLFIVSALFGEEWVPIGEWSMNVQGVMAMLIVLGSIVAFTAFNFLLKRVSPEIVSTSTYINPIVALILGWYFLGEEVSTRSLIAAAVLLSGVYFINTKKKLLMFKRFDKDMEMDMEEK